MLRSAGMLNGLAIWCYTLSPSVYKVNYTEAVESLRFTTLSPGGFGDLSCTISVPNARVPRPELALFSRIVVMSGVDCIWLGEISDSPSEVTDAHEVYSIKALGIGNGLRDDPITTTYLNKTALQIITDQFTGYNRPNFLTVDQDLSAVFPDNPAATSSPAYNTRHMEDVVNDVIAWTGDYAWGVWPHPRNKDNAMYPTGQLQIHVRDKSTTHYKATVAMGDVRYKIQPSGDRAYNVVEIGYNDSSQSTPVGVATYTDPRLNVNFSQGTAPFRRRKYGRDLSNTSTVTLAQAQIIANTYGLQFRDITNKVELTVRNCYDGNGAPVELWKLFADRNFFVPDLAIRGQSISSSPVPGTNQFYIVSATYSETLTDMFVTLQCDNYVDDAAIQIARLTLALDAQRRSSSTSGIVQSTGASEKGACGGEQPHPTAGDLITFMSAYKTVMKNVPTSITLTQVAALNVTGGSLNTSNITVYGFVVGWNATASSNSFWYGSYQTNGNCILAVDEVNETFDHHCDGCQKVTYGNPMSKLVHSVVHEQDCITYTCSSCGASECFNTQLTEEDEGDHHRGQQARHIRRVQDVLMIQGKGKGKKIKQVGI
jgi:hypothetical protein